MFLRKILYISILLMLLISVLGYGFYKALPLILGPKIEIASPQNGEIVEGTTVQIRGTVTRAQKLFVNGVATAFTKEGLFETRTAIYPGNNLLTLTTLDRFNREKSITISVGTK